MCVCVRGLKPSHGDQIFRKKLVARGLMENPRIVANPRFQRDDLAVHGRKIKETSTGTWKETLSILRCDLHCCVAVRPSQKSLIIFFFRSILAREVL